MWTEKQVICSAHYRRMTSLGGGSRHLMPSQIPNCIHDHPGSYCDQQNISRHAHVTVPSQWRPELHENCRRQVIVDYVTWQWPTYRPFPRMSGRYAAIVFLGEAWRAVSGEKLIKIVVMDDGSVPVSKIRVPPPVIHIPVAKFPFVTIPFMAFLTFVSFFMPVFLGFTTPAPGRLVRVCRADRNYSNDDKSQSMNNFQGNFLHDLFPKKVTNLPEGVSDIVLFLNSRNTELVF